MHYLSEPMVTQLDSSLKASVDYTMVGSDIGPSPSSKYFIQENAYESVERYPICPTSVCQIAILSYAFSSACNT